MQVILLDTFGANLIEKVTSVLHGNEESELKISLLEYFPELFGIKKSEEAIPTNEIAEQGKLSAEMQMYKAQRIHHAFKMNQKRHEDEK